MTKEASKPDQSNDPGQAAGTVKKSTSPAAGKVKKPASATRLVLVLLCLAALAAIGASGYTLYELRKAQKQLDSLADKQGKLAGIQASIDQLRSANRKLQQSLNEQAARQAEQAAKQESLAAGLAAAGRKTGNDDRNWLLADIRHLLTVAVQRLTLDRDVTVALAAMQSADDRLRDYNDPDLLPLRRQLTADINSLRAVNPVDISGLALYLIDTSARVEKLPLKPLPKDEKTGSAGTGGKGEQSQKSTWRRLVDEITDTLKGLVRVYHKGEGSTISLMPDQRYYLYQNLRLQLATATRAVLHRQTRDFHTSVKIIQDWLRDNFDTNAPAVSNILDALARMEKIDLQPKLPDISSSLETVRSLARGKTASSPANEADGAAPGQ